MQKLILKSLDRYQALLSAKKFLEEKKKEADFRLSQIGKPKSPGFSEKVKCNGIPLDSRIIAAVTEQEDYEKQLAGVRAELSRLDSILGCLEEPGKTFSIQRYKLGLSWSEIAERSGKAISSVQFLSQSAIQNYVERRYT